MREEQLERDLKAREEIDDLCSLWTINLNPKKRRMRIKGKEKCEERIVGAREKERKGGEEKEERRKRKKVEN